MKIAFAVLSFFAMAVANAAPINTWEAHVKCPGAVTVECWKYIGPDTNHGEDNLLGLVNELGLGEFTSLVRYEYGEGEVPAEFDGGYSLVVFKGGQELWAFTSFADFTEQFRYDVSYTAYFDGQTDRTVSVPEPGSLALLGLALLGAGLTRKLI